GATAVLDHCKQVLDLFAATQIIDNIIHQLDYLMHQRIGISLGALAEIDHLAVEPPALRTPLVFVDQRAPVDAKGGVLFEHRVELDDQRLHRRSQRDTLVDASGDVADTEFERAELWVRAHIPPELLAVVDRAGADQQIDIAIELGARYERRRYAGARKVRKDRTAIGL